MKSLLLLRQAYTENETIGAIYFEDSRVCYTLEPPWKDNRPNISCIPLGRYEVGYMRASSSGKYKDVYWVQGVKDRGGILIHKGNLATHTLGCILPGVIVSQIGGKTAVLNSAKALRDIHSIVNRERFTLHVKNADTNSSKGGA